MALSLKRAVVSVLPLALVFDECMTIRLFNVLYACFCLHLSFFFFFLIKRQAARKKSLSHVGPPHDP